MRLLQTDEQTIKDLEIFGTNGIKGIFDLYNRSHTKGGEKLLQQLFTQPLSDKNAINERSSIIEYFANSGISFPYQAAVFDQVEKYLATAINTVNDQKTDRSHLSEKEMRNGVHALIRLISDTKRFMEDERIAGCRAYEGEKSQIMLLLSHPGFIPVFRETSLDKLSFGAVTAYDSLFRLTKKDEILQLLSHLYYLDLCISVSQVAVERHFIFPKASDPHPSELQIRGVYHPTLKKPVGNDIWMTSSRNVILLTGANMAGKSTFLRSISTALYLAHMGFPVAAVQMQFSVLDGIFTTINLPDNLGTGASHFYAEVTRVKKVAHALSTGKRYFILFDELFRGTNVKDALEATVAVMQGFARQSKSLFLVSSHIVEAAVSLGQENSIDYLYLPTKMNGNVPEYTYKLEKGVTDDRHGMIIIRNEGILAILQNGQKILRGGAVQSITAHSM